MALAEKTAKRKAVLLTSFPYVRMESETIWSGALHSFAALVCLPGP